MTEDYVALDLETTGLRRMEDRILEIGAVRVRNGQVEEIYSTLVNPEMRISAQITELTGITDEMAATGKSQASAVRELVEFCADLPLLGHNILFDYSFVKRAAVNMGLEFEKNGVDTLRIARALLTGLDSRGLSSVCGYYGIQREREHRAVDDATAAMEIYGRMRAQFPDSPEELFNPRPLVFKVKKQGSITAAQKGYLNDLVKYHKITLDVSVDSLTKNAASRIIDKIILNYGRIQR